MSTKSEPVKVLKYSDRCVKILMTCNGKLLIGFMIVSVLVQQSMMTGKAQEVGMTRSDVSR